MLLRRICSKNQKYGQYRFKRLIQTRPESHTCKAATSFLNQHSYISSFVLGSLFLIASAEEKNEQNKLIEKVWFSLLSKFKSIDEIYYEMRSAFIGLEDEVILENLRFLVEEGQFETPYRKNYALGLLIGLIISHTEHQEVFLEVIFGTL